MIDLENAKKEFEKYISNYNQKDTEIKRKIDHSYRVSKISKKIAESLNLEKEEIEIAELIGLLHDIAKIDQRSNNVVYKDLENTEHGNAGAIILERNNYLRNYIQKNKYDNYIKTAIVNHSKYAIQKNLKEQELLFSKIIRDADKIDILYQASTIFWKNGVRVNEQISKKVIEEFKEKIKIHRENVKNTIDRIISTISMIYDINYLKSFEIIKENNYINKIIDKLEIEDKETKENVENIRKISNKYIENKIQEGR